MKRILFVDDDASVRASFRRSLRRHGYDLWEARNGNDAIRLLAQTSMSLVVTDILMPDRNGINAIKEIRKRWPNIKIIAMSCGGYSDAGVYIDQCLKLGAECVMEKPFPVRELLVVMEDILDG